MGPATVLEILPPPKIVFSEVRPRKAKVVVLFYTEIASGTWRKRYLKLDGDTRMPRGFGANETEILP